jgi:TPR repeat protein
VENRKFAGNAEAKFRIGGLYARGEGVFHSIPDAVAWYKLAAEDGHGEAQFHLGRIYLHGAPRQRHHANWLAQAGASNESVTQSNVKLLFPNGIEVEKNKALGHRWIEAAARPPTRSWRAPAEPVRTSCKSIILALLVRLHP